jgi:hypothetical protein
MAHRAASDGAATGPSQDDNLSPDRSDIIRGILDRVIVSKIAPRIVMSEETTEKGNAKR